MPRRKQPFEENQTNELNEDNSKTGGNFTFDKFDGEVESWSCFTDRLENYFDLVGVSNNDNRKAQILLQCMGIRLFQDVTEFLNPVKPRSLGYDELIKTIEYIVDPRPSQIVEQYNFTIHKQLEGENIRQYLNELKKLANYCKFHCNKCQASTMEDHVRQQFITGLRDANILQKLLQSHENMSLSDCIAMAESVEKSVDESRNMLSRFNEGLQSIERRSTGNHKKLRCYRCRSDTHLANACRHKTSTCELCKKVGHIRRACRLNGNQMVLDELSDDQVGFDAPDVVVDVHQINLPEVTKKPDKILVRCVIDGHPTTFEYDTGAAVTTISLATFRKLYPNKRVNKTNLKLATYTGELIKPVGYATVNIEYNGSKSTGNIYIIDDSVHPILGREWMKFVNKVSTIQISQIKIDDEVISGMVTKLECDFPGVFADDLGKFPGFKGHIQLKHDARPIFKPVRSLPFAIKDKVESEIDRLEKEGVITKINYSDWGTPVVPIIKPGGSIRLCADYKVTVNNVTHDLSYPIPRQEDIFAKMANGAVFTTLDIKKAYLHIEMDEASANIQAISTTKGVYRVNRLMFGIKVAPAIWQRVMSETLEGIPGVAVFYDDIIIQGRNIDENRQRVTQVMERLKTKNLRVNKEKCKFFREEVMYLGHKISKTGIKKCEEKVKAIVEAPQPKNVTELKSWLGLVNYYGKFVPNLASKLAPLHKLLSKNVLYLWSQEAENSFKKVKEDITSDKVLMPYNEEMSLTLATDASPYGLGAVLSHRLTNGEERPIAYASRSLSSAERNYSQIDKEATAIYWAVHKFFGYCYGRRFTLVTDHKPLVAIFGSNSNLPTLVAHRLLRYAVFLQGFDYNIEYRSTKEHCNADALSRLPLEEPCVGIPDESALYQAEQLSHLSVTHEQITKETERDEVLKCILHDLMKGNHINSKCYKNMQAELTVHNGCIFRGFRIVIPKSLQKEILLELHSAHIGVAKMKMLARNYVWWPAIDKNIEELCASCETCAQYNKAPPKTIDHPWEEAEDPWMRIHIDYAGPLMNHYLLIVVDSYSKWVEVVPVRTISSQKTIEILRDMFARFGIPSTVISDNASYFTSREFSEFMNSNHISFRTIAPYHPSSNGQAERYVQSVKTSLKKLAHEGGNLNKKLCQFLLAYRRAPHATTGVSPSELMLGRRVRSLIDLVKPVERQYQECKADCKRNFCEGDSVMVRSFHNRNARWMKGVISKKLGHVLYLVKCDHGIVKRHVDQIKRVLMSGAF